MAHAQATQAQAEPVDSYPSPSTHPEVDYTFEVRTVATVTVKARSRGHAKDLIDDFLIGPCRAMGSNWPSGRQVQFHIVVDDFDPLLLAIDGRGLQA